MAKAIAKKENDIEGQIAKGRTLPHSVEAEQNLLGCLINDNEIATDVMGEISIDWFYLQSHKDLFNAMYQIHLSNNPIELATLTDELERNGKLAQIGGIEYLLTLTDSMPSSANYKVYKTIVERCFILRNLIRTCAGIIEDAYVSSSHEASTATAEQKIYDISRGKVNKSIINIADTISDVLVKFDQAHRDKGAINGIASGIIGLDSKTRGFQKGNLIILAARTGIGKTSLAMNMAEHAGLLGKKVAIFSLEMPNTEIAQRLLCSLSGVSMEKALKGRLNEFDWAKINKASDLLNKIKIFVDDSSVTTPSQILAKCRRLKAREGLDFVIIDYLQLMTMDAGRPAESRQREISEISRYLKIMAKDLEVPVLALSQLSREADKRENKEGKKPILSDLRESGSIEQDADMVLFIYRKQGEEVVATDSEQDAEINIAKNRNGATGTINVKWLPQIVRFVNDDAEAKQKLDGSSKEIVTDYQGEDVALPNENDAPIEQDDNQPIQVNLEQVELATDAKVQHKPDQDTKGSNGGLDY
ncbi:MAG: replicative DNA helicase [Clostridia bacterium]